MANVTGGAIKAEKSWWYLIHYNWTEDGIWTYADKEDMTNKELVATTSEGEEKILKKLEISKGQKMLGV